MPNHVSTIFRMTGDKKQIAKFIEGITIVGETQAKYDGTKEKYDFLQLLPCPPELLEVSSPVSIVSEAEYEKAKEERAADLAAKKGAAADFVRGLPLTAKRSVELIKKYGANNWYDWMHDNIGTKWGMYDIACRDEGAAEFFYMTAWSPATAYFLNVSKSFKKIEFYHEFVDEGGCFVGYQKIKNGKVIEEGSYEWKSAEGIEIRQNTGCYCEDEEDDDDEAENGVI